MGIAGVFAWRLERPWNGRDFGLAVRVFGMGWTRILERSSDWRARRVPPGDFLRGVAGADFWGCASCQAAAGFPRRTFLARQGRGGKQTAARGAMLLAKMPDKSSNPFQVKRAGTDPNSGRH